MNDFTERPGSEERRAQFSIRSLMIWTAIVAVGAAIVGAVQRLGGGLGDYESEYIIFALGVYSVLVLIVLVHVRYRWNDSYVNFATAMNVFYSGWILYACFVPSGESVFYGLGVPMCCLLAIPFGITMIVGNLRKYTEGRRYSPLFCFYTLASAFVWTLYMFFILFALMTGAMM